MPSDPRTPPATLILLPGGWCVSGVAVWAARLASGLAAQGGRVSVVTFRPPPEASPLTIEIDPRVRVIDLGHLPPIETCEGEIGMYLPAISREALRLAEADAVCVLPNQHGDCFGIAAALSLALPDRVRVIGTAHSDNTYDLRLLSHYAPCLSRFVGVSQHLHAQLNSALPDRSEDTAHIPYGIDVSDPMTPERDPDRALRLLYTGRFEHRQKRILALPALARELTRRGIAHRLTIVGDGPARRELEGAARDCPSITILPPASPESVRTLLESHDAFVLPSRYEGLSIAMLEALGAGCVPIVARVASGAGEAIDPGETGLIADVGPEADEEETALALANAIGGVQRDQLIAMSRGATKAARTRFSLELHLRRWSELLQQAVQTNPRPWPATRPCAFTGTGQHSGSVPPGASAALKRTLAALAGRPLVIHGGGRHTIELAPLLAHADVRAIADDDPARFGEKLLGWKIIDPQSAAMTGATDVIISSAMHEAAIWDRRDMYEEQGLTVHRLYAAATSESRLAAATNP